MSDEKPGRLHARALELAKCHSLDECIRYTGLPSSWLAKFRRGSIKSPSVNRIETIIEALSGEPIRLPS